MKVNGTKKAEPYLWIAVKERQMLSPILFQASNNKKLVVISIQKTKDSQEKQKQIQDQRLKTKIFEN